MKWINKQQAEEQRRRRDLQRLQTLESIASYAVTCKSQNTDEWMTGLAEELNSLLELDRDTRRCVLTRHGLALRTEKEF